MGWTQKNITDLVEGGEHMKKESPVEFKSMTHLLSGAEWFEQKLIMYGYEGSPIYGKLIPYLEKARKNNVGNIVNDLEVYEINYFL